MHKKNSQKVSLLLNVEKILTPVDIAIPFGLIINELVTNSLRHAFPENCNGSIELHMKRYGENGIMLSIVDNGVGFQPGFDPRTCKSIGLSTTILIVEQQLQGSIEFSRSNGFSCRISFSDNLYRTRI
jgi:two-component sensor histidine kinase